MTDDMNGEKADETDCFPLDGPGHEIDPSTPEAGSPRSVIAPAPASARLAGVGAARDAEARGVGRGRHHVGVTLTSRAQLADELVVLPKLFRRLAEYLALEADQTSVDLAQFQGFLAAHADALFPVPDGHATTLDTLVQVTGQTVRLTVPPERIVFADK